MAAAARSLDRVTRIFRLANDHWQVVESLNTRDYLDFRDKLFPASGFQSAQMREIEIMLGLGEDERVGFGEQGQVARGPEDARRPRLLGAGARAGRQGGHAQPAAGGRRLALPDADPRLAAGRPERRHGRRRLHRRLPRRAAPDDRGHHGGTPGRASQRRGATGHPRALPQARSTRRKAGSRPATRACAASAPRSSSSSPTATAAAVVAARGPGSARRDGAVDPDLPPAPRPHGGADHRPSGGYGRKQRSASTSTRRRSLYRVFKDLWAARTYLLPEGALPVLEDTAYYDFPERS